MRGGDFDLVDHGIKNEQLIVAHGSDIISWKESDGQRLRHHLMARIARLSKVYLLSYITMTRMSKMKTTDYTGVSDK